MTIVIRNLIIALAVFPAFLSAQTVKIPDLNLRAAVLAELGRTEGDITASDLAGLKQLIAPNKGIRSFEGLEHAANLEILDLNENFMQSVFLPEHMPHLKTLRLRGRTVGYSSIYAGIHAIRFPESVPALEVLDLSNNNLEFLVLPDAMPSLKRFNISGNPLRDSLGKLTKYPLLEDIDFTNISNVRGVSFLTDLPQLTRLALQTSGSGWGQFVDIMGDLVNLKTLHLRFPDRTVVDRLHQLPGLEELSLNYGTHTSLPVELSNLRSLSILANRMGADVIVPASYVNLESLVLRQVYGGRIRVPNLPRLRELEISMIGVHAVELPSELLEMRVLNLEFSSQSLLSPQLTVTLPDQMPELSSLRLINNFGAKDKLQLNLSGDLARLKHLEVFGPFQGFTLPPALTELETLIINNPDYSGELSIGEEMNNLASLNLSGNAITHLELHKDLAKLRELDVSNTNLETLEVPSSIELLRLNGIPWNSLDPLSGGAGVRQLELGGSFLSEMRGLANLPNLVSASVTHYGTTQLEIPEGLTGLEELSLYVQNGITSWPEDLDRLRKLTYTGEISSGTPFLSKFPELEHLNLSGIIRQSEGDRTISIPGNMTRLAVLDLSGSNFSSLDLPQGMSSIREIHLGYAEIQSLTLPGGLVNLTTLDVDQLGSLEELQLPDDLFSLTALNLQRANISDLVLPEGLNQLASLVGPSNREIDLTFPESMPRLTHLSIMDSTGRSLDNLPSDSPLTVFKLANWNREDPGSRLHLPKDLPTLRVLDAQNCNISSIAWPDNLENLRHVYLSGNRITELELPDEVPNLATLSLVNNTMKEYDLPASATGLVQLNLAGNLLSSLTLPEGYGQLSVIDVSNNGLTSFTLPRGMGRLFSLSLSNNILDSILFEEPAPWLEHLYLSGNRLADVAFLRDHLRLRTLSLNNNRLAEFTLPQGMTQLEILDIGNNGLAGFSLEESLPYLRQFVATGNQLGDLSFIPKMPDLEFLDLSYNMLDGVPLPVEVISLQSVSLRGNQLKDFTFIQNMPNLNFLDISENELSGVELPNGEWESLTFLALNGNSIRDLSFLSQFPNLSYLTFLGSVGSIVVPELPEIRVISVASGAKVYLTPRMVQRWRTGQLTINGTNRFYVYNPNLRISSIRRDSEFEMKRLELEIEGLYIDAVLEYSDDLVTWTRQRSLTGTGTGRLTVTLTPPVLQRFYRVRNGDTQVRRAF